MDDNVLKAKAIINFIYGKRVKEIMDNVQMLNAAKTYDTLVQWLPAQIVYEMEQYNMAKENDVEFAAEIRYNHIEALCMVLDRMHYTTTWDFRKERFSALYVSAPYGGKRTRYPIATFTP